MIDKEINMFAARVCISQPFHVDILKDGKFVIPICGARKFSAFSCKNIYLLNHSNNNFVKEGRKNMKRCKNIVICEKCLNHPKFIFRKCWLFLNELNKR